MRYLDTLWNYMPTSLQKAITILQNTIAELLASLPGLLIAMLIFYAIYRISRMIELGIVATLRRAKYSRSLQIVLARLGRWLIVFSGFLLATTIALPSFSPSELIGLLGIGSVAIGFAFREVLQNFLAGILILLNEPFRIGDQIIIGDYEGTVEDIQIRATYVRTYDNRRAVIPNSDLFTGSVMVNTAYDKRRNEYDIGISYDDDIEAAQNLCVATLREIDGVLDNPPPDTIMMEMGDSAIVFRVRWWTNPRQANVLRVQNLVLRTLKNRLTDAGFNIPFPIRTVHFNDHTEHALENDRQPTS